MMKQLAQSHKTKLCQIHDENTRGWGSRKKGGTQESQGLNRRGVLGEGRDTYDCLPMGWPRDPLAMVTLSSPVPYAPT